MKQFLHFEEMMGALEQRYAVKQFEKGPHMFEKDLKEIVTSILQITPTSFGLQAYKFFIIENMGIRESLKEVSWGQSQITDADMLVVFTVPTNFDVTYIQKHIQHMQTIRGFDDSKKESIIGFMDEKIIKTGEQIGITSYEEWLTRQTYIALGNLMTSLAVLGIDACPIEGMEPMQYNKILGLDEKNLTAKVAIVIGKRSKEDVYQDAKKVRFPKTELFVTI